MNSHAVLKYLNAGLLQLSLLLLICPIPRVCGESAPLPVEPIVELRGIGSLKATARYYGAEAKRSSWITLCAADNEKAVACASKYLQDMLGFGEVKPGNDTSVPGTYLSLDGAGMWVLGTEGANFHIVFARSKEDLASILNTAGAAKWRAVGRDDYPKWLDCMDNASMCFWFSGFGILPKDIPAELKWYEDNQFTLCSVLGNSELRLLAPGVLDTSIIDWYSAVVRQYKIPYKMMASMAHPLRPEAFWNYAPLPNLVASEGHLANFPADYARLTMYAGFQPVVETDRYMMDYRRRVASRVESDPFFSGHHVMQEMPGSSWSLLSLASVAGTPHIQELWRTYLREVLKIDLKEAARRYRDDGGSYSAWSEVQIPALKQIAGWDSSAIDLKGMWLGRADRAKKGESEKWFDESAALDQWKPVDGQDVCIMLYSGGTPACNYWLQKSFSVPENADLNKPGFLHLARSGFMGETSPFNDVWINGKPLKLVSSTDPSVPQWDLCYEVTGTLRPGENRIVINTKGAPIPSYVFIGGRGKWVYPGQSDVINRRYFDSLMFNDWLVMRALEDRMIGIRAGESNRPMKIMAPHNSLGSILDLCARYGAYPHDTGLAGAIWAPFSYSRYAFLRGIPNSAEEGGFPEDVPTLQANMTRYLMTGVDMVDNVGHMIKYSQHPGKSAWITENRELLRCIGKLDLQPPSVVLLRSGRELQLGLGDIYQWDLGRGAMPAVGRAFHYAELADLKSGRANGYRVLIDSATTIMTEEDVEALEQYVRQGGIFVALHNTGMHTPERAYTWPISRLTGLRVAADVELPEGGKIRFTQDETLWPSYRGQELEGRGQVMDWQKHDWTGVSRSFTAVDKGVQIVAEWVGQKSGSNIAIAVRPVGKGKVVTLGSTFWRKAKDENGRYEESGTAPYLDELLASLGVPRETNAGELWVEPWRSKNGIYDVYPVAQLNSKAPEVTTDVKIRCKQPVAKLWEVSALSHPAQTPHYAEGWLTIPQVKMAAMQSRVYATPRQDVENAALHWIEVQKRQWGKLPELASADKARATVEPVKDILLLDEGWQCATNEKNKSWIAPGDTASKNWKTVKLGTFMAMGLPEDSLAQFRKEIVLPDDWQDQRITLHFDAEGWFWGIGLSGKLWINGEPAAVSQPLKPEPSGSFTIELAPKQLKERALVIALEVDGRQTNKAEGQPRPSGVTGSFFLHMTPQPVQMTPLKEWFSASDLNVLTPTEVGKSVECMYLETKFTLPANWPSKRLYLKSSVSLGALFINNQYVAAPKLMQELDISGLVKREGENILRWVPGLPRPEWQKPYKGKVPELNLMWLPDQKNSMSQFQKFDIRAKNGESLNVVFLGGSLTWGAQATDPQLKSWRALVSRHLEEAYPMARFRFWDAAIGGTGSQLGAFRLDRDVLSRKPDLVFLDFTINDDPYVKPEADRLASYEALVRRIVMEGSALVQVLLPAKKDVQSGPPSRPLDERHKEIGRAYGLPIADVVAWARLQVAAGKTSPDRLWDMATDGTHPGDAGYALYSDAIWTTLQKAIKEKRQCGVPETMLHADTYMTVNRFRLSSAVSLPSGWKPAAPNRSAIAFDFTPSRWMDEVLVVRCLENNKSERPEAYVMSVRGRNLFVFGEFTPQSGKYRVRVDGKEVKTADPGAISSQGNGRYMELLAQNLNAAELHRVEIVPELKSGQELRLESLCVAGAPALVSIP